MTQLFGDKALIQALRKKHFVVSKWQKKGVNNAITTHSFVWILFCATGLSSGISGLINYLSCVGLDFCSRFKFCIFLLATIIFLCWLQVQHNRQVVARILKLTQAHRSHSFLHIHTVNICRILSSPLVTAEAWALRCQGNVKLSEDRVDGTTINTTAGARGRRNGWRRPTAAVLVSVWPLGGRTQPRCSEGSSSASPLGRSSSAASRCPGSQTRSCSRTHLDTRQKSFLFVFFLCFTSCIFKVSHIKTTGLKKSKVP